MEIALGAISGVDALIDTGHETACEYGCQLLFDETREKISNRKNLPIAVVQHLLNDRLESIKLNTIENNWDALTPGQQQEFLEGAEVIFGEVPEQEKHEIWKGYRNKFSDNHKHVARIIQHRLKDALRRRDETAVLWCIDMVGIENNRLPGFDQGVDRKDAFKNMPTLLRRYWKMMNGRAYGETDLITVHPDEAVRKEAVQRIMDKKTKVKDLSAWSSCIGGARRGETLKGNILKEWVNDDSVDIRKLIASTTTAIEVLTPLAADTSPIVSKIATRRLAKYTKSRNYSRTYSVAYQAKKKDERQKEEEARRKERGW